MIHRVRGCSDLWCVVLPKEVCVLEVLNITSLVCVVDYIVEYPMVSGDWM